MLIVFVILIIGPVIVRNYISNLPSIPLELMQPTGQDNNDTSNSQTGTALVGGVAATGGGSSGGGGGSANTATSSTDGFSFATGFRRF